MTDDTISPTSTTAQLTHRICGVIVTQGEHAELDAIRKSGVCLYCGRAGLTNRYGNAKRHSLACAKNRTLLDIERCLAARLTAEEGRHAKRMKWSAGTDRR